jgi:hypothetical protein
VTPAAPFRDSSGPPVRTASTSEHLHTEIVQPTLILLADERFANVDSVYRKAFDRALSGDPSGALTAATSAVEEMLRLGLGTTGGTLGPLADKARTMGWTSSAITEFIKKLYALREESDAHQAGTSERDVAMLGLHLTGSILLYFWSVGPFELGAAGGPPRRPSRASPPYID